VWVKYDVKRPHARKDYFQSNCSFKKKHAASRAAIGRQVHPVLILQLIYLSRLLRNNWRLSSYRTESEAEVDLIIERDEEILAIEIKARRNVSRSDTRGLFSLAEVVGKYTPLKKGLFYTGEQEQSLENGVRVLPYIKGLEELRLA
jgi:predicted AAA+ superfamily ATPase